MSSEPEDGPAIYDLCGVINHMGRLLGGHYTSYARLVSRADTRQSELGECRVIMGEGEGCAWERERERYREVFLFLLNSFLLPTDWRLFDDSRVSFCPESRVVNEQAYLLLYRRRDTPFNLYRQPPPPQPQPQPQTSAVSQEENGMEHLETEEATPMSISSASQQSSSSQPSSSSMEGEEQIGTTQEELD